ncbi:MAG: efflux RND transporter periplasmic adaptor subunit [Vicinamibacterales bacterium]
MRARPFSGVAAMVLVAGVSGLATACGGGTDAAARGSAPDAQNAEPRTVQTVAAEEARLERTIDVTGTLAAEEQVTLSFKVVGRLDSLAVDLGSSVERGDIIGRLTPTDFQLRVNQADAALQQARARLGLAGGGSDDTVVVEQTAVVRQARAVLDQAKLTRDRAEAFLKDGIGSQASFDEADAAWKVAEGRFQDAIEEVRNRQALLTQRRTELELARQALTDSTLTAPFAGRVRERHVTAGQYLATGAPVVTIVRVNPLRLRLSIPEREAASVRVGLPVRVTLEGDAVEHEGRVVRISPAIEESSRTLSIEAEVANPTGVLRPGAFANAEVVTESRDVSVLVPESALSSFAGVDKVFVVVGGKAVERRVTLGRRHDGRVEVLEGLKAGDVVIDLPGNLVDGQAVSSTGARS